jgi:type 2 lantibiotic biosynthesis protein LanM
MASVVSDQPWANAYDLAERLRIPSQPADQADSRRRLQQWQQLFASHRDVWAQRVQSTDISEAVLGQVFSTAPEAPAGAAPDWWTWIERAWRSLQPCLVFDETQEHSVERFLHVVEPLIAHGIARLRQDVRQLQQRTPELPFDPPGIQRVLFARLPGILLNIIMRTLVLELNVARLRSDLPGTTAESRFNAFIENLKHPAAQQAIFGEYPVLARAVATAVEQWVAASGELLQRLSADWAAIEAALAPGASLGTLASVQWSGDRHHHGRSVAILGFESGRQIVYKPKSVAVEAQLQTLLGWINAQGLSTPFRLLNVLERQGYGWVEFVQAADCTDPGQIERFYRRQGAYLALLYLLHATDFHAENIIAAGEHPMLIDLESLFHAPLGNPAAPSSHQAVVQSVLQVGMLPQRWWASDDYDGVDVSGLGGAAGQLSPEALPDWQGTNTDAMHLVRKRRPMQATKNRPTLNGTEVEVQDYCPALLAGFQEMYRLLADRRSAVGPLLQEFGAVEVRVIARATRTYSSLLNESFHPDLLRNALDRDLLFERLWFGVRQQPLLAGLVPIEQAALRRGDIPHFTTRQPRGRSGATAR